MILSSKVWLSYIEKYINFWVLFPGSRSQRKKAYINVSFHQKKLHKLHFNKNDSVLKTFLYEMYKRRNF